MSLWKFEKAKGNHCYVCQFLRQIMRKLNRDSERTVCEGDHVYPKSQQTLHPARNICLDIAVLRVEIHNFQNLHQIMKPL